MQAMPRTSQPGGQRSDGTNGDWVRIAVDTGPDHDLVLKTVAEDMKLCLDYAAEKGVMLAEWFPLIVTKTYTCTFAIS